jgi:hypothetical protein
LLPLNMIPPFSWLSDSNNITRVRHANLGNADHLSIMCWSTCGNAKWSTKMRRTTYGNADRSSTRWLLCYFKFLQEHGLSKQWVAKKLSWLLNGPSTMSLVG